MDSHDWVGLVGLGMMFAGLAMISLPLALMVTGAVLLGVGLMGAVHRMRG